MAHLEIIEAFKLTAPKDLISIYPYSPVYKIKHNFQEVIVKQSRSQLPEAINISNFLSKLSDNGIDIVTSVTLDVPNPQLIDNQVWVVYPYISGHTYSGTSQEIFSAGQLLGKIHSLSLSNNQETLSVYDEFDFEEDDIKQDLLTIEKYLDLCEVPFDLKALYDSLPRFINQQTLLQKADLPKVATPYDYKADNLIYREDNKPFLIDPDNALFIPRIFDLALSLLLFHNVFKSAPNHIFTRDEWQIFLEGYYEFISLTEEEKILWPLAIQHIFIDEIVWLMVDFKDGWENNRQRDLFISILSFIDGDEYYEI